MRIKDIVLNRQIDSEIITTEEAERFKSNAILIDGWWESSGSIERAPLKGFGDVIARAATTLGFKSCNRCKSRQKKINKILPFNRS